MDSATTIDAALIRSSAQYIARASKTSDLLKSKALTCQNIECLLLFARFEAVCNSVKKNQKAFRINDF